MSYDIQISAIQSRFILLSLYMKRETRPRVENKTRAIYADLNFNAVF